MDSPSVAIVEIVGKAGAFLQSSGRREATDPPGTCRVFPASSPRLAAGVGIAAVIDLMVANAENPEYQWWCCDAITGLCAGSGAFP